jgi:hypothetical protein
MDRLQIKCTALIITKTITLFSVHTCPQANRCTCSPTKVTKALRALHACDGQTQQKLSIICCSWKSLRLAFSFTMFQTAWVSQILPFQLPDSAGSVKLFLKRMPSDQGTHGTLRKEEESRSEYLKGGIKVLWYVDWWGPKWMWFRVC